jgi:hypothetical protein
MFLADEKFFVPLLRNAKTMKELVDDAGARIRKELKRFPEKTRETAGLSAIAEPSTGTRSIRSHTCMEVIYERRLL